MASARASESNVHQLLIHGAVLISDITTTERLERPRCRASHPFQTQPVCRDGAAAGPYSWWALQLVRTSGGAFGAAFGSGLMRLVGGQPAGVLSACRCTIL